MATQKAPGNIEMPQKDGSNVPSRVNYPSTKPIGFSEAAQNGT